MKRVKGYTLTRYEGDKRMEILYAITDAGKVYVSDKHEFNNAFVGPWGWTYRPIMNEELVRGFGAEYCGYYDVDFAH